MQQELEADIQESVIKAEVKPALHDDDRADDDSDDEDFLEIQKLTGSGASAQTESIKSNMKLETADSTSRSSRRKDDDFVDMTNESDMDNDDDVSESDDAYYSNDDDDDVSDEDSGSDVSGDSKAEANKSKHKKQSKTSSDVQEGRTVFIRFETVPIFDRVTQV